MTEFPSLAVTPTTRLPQMTLQPQGAWRAPPTVSPTSGPIDRTSSPPVDSFQTRLTDLHSQLAAQRAWRAQYEATRVQDEKKYQHLHETMTKLQAEVAKQSAKIAEQHTLIQELAALNQDMAARESKFETRIDILSHSIMQNSTELKRLLHHLRGGLPMGQPPVHPSSPGQGESTQTSCGNVSTHGDDDSTAAADLSSAEIYFSRSTMETDTDSSDSEDYDLNRCLYH
eukprot:scaffold11038_cov119-Cylindrotheca_fusiformis.AAC.1